MMNKKSLYKLEYNKIIDEKLKEKEKDLMTI